jgi:hypothetical protein
MPTFGYANPNFVVDHTAMFFLFLRYLLTCFYSFLFVDNNEFVFVIL